MCDIFPFSSFSFKNKRKKKKIYIETSFVITNIPFVNGFSVGLMDMAFSSWNLSFSSCLLEILKNSFRLYGLQVSLFSIAIENIVFVTILLFINTLLYAIFYIRKSLSFYRIYEILSIISGVLKK